MMNFLGLGPFRKGQSSSTNGKGESQGDVAGGGGGLLSLVKKSESGTGGNGKEKDKEPGNGKLVTEAGESSAAVGKTGGGGNTSTSNKKGSKANESATATASSSTKIKLNKTISGGGGGGRSSNNGNLRSSSRKAQITQSLENHPTITSFGANGTAAAVVAGVIAAEDPAKKELDELKERASEVANESLASTRRMAEYCENAKDAGIKIIVALDDQKEQLDRIQDSLTVMREDLIHAEKNLRGMDKCCGIFNNPFKKTNFKEDERMWTDGLDGAVVADNATVPRRPFAPAPTLGWPLNRSSGSSKDQNNSNNPGGSGGYIPKITEDETEDEMEKNMDLVSSMLGNLRNMAIDMNTEIESQNKQMNIINDMTEQNNARIDDAIQKTHDLKRQ